MAKRPNDELLKIAKEQYRRARTHSGKRKKEMRRCYDFYANRQWNDDVKTKLEASGRAAVVMNRIKPRVSAVVGMEISNRQEIRFSPREESDQALVDLINAASEWTRDQAETEDHETEQFQDMVITGMGWSETVMSYDDNLDGIAAVERRSPLNYDWDPDSRLANLADARYVFHSQDIPREEFKMLFPGKEAKAGQTALGVSELWDISMTPHNADDAKYYPNEVPSYPGADRGDSSMEWVRLVDYQYAVMEPVWRVMLPNGKMRTIDPAKVDDFKTAIEKVKSKKVEFKQFKKNTKIEVGTGENTILLPYVEQAQRKIYRAFFSGDEVVDHDVAPCPYTFTHHCMTGWRDETTGYWFGMVDGLIPPQEWANKFFSQAIYIYTVNPKGGAYVERDAVDNPSDFEDNFAAPDAVTWVNPGAIREGKIMERKPGQYPSDLDKLTAFAIDSLPALDGLNPEVMGTAGRDQPGLLEKMRKQAGMTILAPLFDAKRRYHKRQGRTLLHYISNYFTDAQLTRVTGKQVDPKVLQLLRAQDVRHYDVIVDDAPSSPNQKEYNLNILMEFVRQAPQAASALAPILIRNSPLTQEVQNQIIEALKPLAAATNTPEYKALSQQMQKLQQENQKLKAGTEVGMAKVQAKAQADQARMTMKGQEVKAGLAMDAQQMMAELELKREEMEEENRIAWARLRDEFEIRMAQVAVNEAAAMEKAEHGDHAN